MTAATAPNMFSFADGIWIPASLTTFAWPDCAPVAVALGGAGVTVRNEDDLVAAGKAIANRDRPLLIDLKLDPDNMPELAK